MSIPKLSTPLAKGIRTTEGILTTVISGLIVLVSGVDPSTLPRKEAAIVTAGLAGLFMVQRGLLKVVAIQKGFGVAAPIDNAKFEHTVAAITDQGAKLDDFINQHGQVITALENAGIGDLPTKTQIQDMMKKFEELLAQQPASAPTPAPEPAPAPAPVPVEDPVAVAAAGVSEADVAAEVPPTLQTGDPSPATPSAAASVPPPAVDDPAQMAPSQPTIVVPDDVNVVTASEEQVTAAAGAVQDPPATQPFTPLEVSGE